jgi:catechol 2,3-dioxygenase-like lactoylglutathione lyase family enzyme
MVLARFRKLCVDANDPSLLGRFWAEILDLAWEPDGRGEGGLFGMTRQPTIWVNRVPEPKTVKHRVHLDMYAARLADLEALGSRIVLPEGDDRRWTVMADPEGGEYCAFLRAELPATRLHGLVVDSVDPARQARWWAEVLGGTVVDSTAGFSTVENAPGTSFTMDFVPVPEPKTVKNRIHWDLTVSDPQALIDAGATVVRPRGGDIAWQVLADPEGNEFCAFGEERPG